MSVLFVEGCPKVAVRREIVYLSYLLDGEPTVIATPLFDFRQAMAAGTRALREYDARKARVVPIKRKRGHAAT